MFQCLSATYFITEGKILNFFQHILLMCIITVPPWNFSHLLLINNPGKELKFHKKRSGIQEVSYTRIKYIFYYIWRKKMHYFLYRLKFNRLIICINLCTWHIPANLRVAQAREFQITVTVNSHFQSSLGNTWLQGRILLRLKFYKYKLVPKLFH